MTWDQVYSMLNGNLWLGGILCVLAAVITHIASMKIRYSRSGELAVEQQRKEIYALLIQMLQAEEPREMRIAKLNTLMMQDRSIIPYPIQHELLRVNEENCDTDALEKMVELYYERTQAKLKDREPAGKRQAPHTGVWKAIGVVVFLLWLLCASSTAALAFAGTNIFHVSSPALFSAMAHFAVYGTIFGYVFIILRLSWPSRLYAE